MSISRTMLPFPNPREKKKKYTRSEFYVICRQREYPDIIKIPSTFGLISGIIILSRIVIGDIFSF